MKQMTYMPSVIFFLIMDCTCINVEMYMFSVTSDYVIRSGTLDRETVKKYRSKDASE